MKNTALGLSAVPEDWVVRFEKSAYLDGLAQRLAMKKKGLED